jgi:hypothetical protein
MKLSSRHFAGALLLIAALAISYGLVESLQRGPCPGEREGWIAGRVISAAFALYFFASAWMAVRCKYVGMAIVTLLAWHLLVLSLFLPSDFFSRYRGLDRFRQAVGFGFWEFVIATSLVAIASCFALFWRYRMVNGSPAAVRRRFLRLCVAGATVVSVALAAGAYWIVPHLGEVYSTFGVDLPAPTLLLRDMYRYWIALPLACVLGLLYVGIRDQYSERQLQIALNSAVGLVILLNLAASIFLFSMLAPFLRLGQCV